MNRPEVWELVLVKQDGSVIVYFRTIFKPFGDNRFPKAIREIDSPFVGGINIDDSVKEIIFRRVSR